MTERQFGNTLIVGGTGMLSAVCRHMAKHSDSITLAARNPGKLASEIGATPLSLDWKRQKTSGLDILERFDLIISWLHDSGLWLVPHLENLLVPGGRSIRIHGSAFNDEQRRTSRNPGLTEDLKHQTIILGWVNKAGHRRWLNHDEICAAVIKTVDSEDMPLVIAGCLDD